MATEQAKNTAYDIILHHKVRIAKMLANYCLIEADRALALQAVIQTTKCISFGFVLFLTTFHL